MVDETEGHFLTMDKEKSSDTIVGAIFFTTLYIIIASASIFSGVLSQNYLSEVVLRYHLNDHNILILAFFHVSY